MQENRYIQGNIQKGMLHFVIPCLLGMILQSLYGAVDLFVVGQFATTADVSAVTIGSQLMNMPTQLIIGLATGITVLIGQQFGARQEKALARTVANAIFLFGGIAVVLTVLYFAMLRPVTTLMRTPAEAVEATQDYLFACSIGLVFIVGYNVISSILMGLGDTRTPFIFVAIACVINIVLDIYLVKYVHMGALGAAIATTIAQAGSFVFSLLYIAKKGLGFPFGKEDLKGNKSVMSNTVKIGAPIAIQNILVGVSFLFITAVINEMGLASSAAAGVVEKLFGFFFMPAAAFGSAVATISAQNIGAGHFKRARQSMWAGIWMALIPSILLVILSQFMGGTFASLFSNDAEVIGLATLYLSSYVLDCAMVSLIFPMNGYFNATGYSWFSMLHSLVATFLFRIPLSYLFSRLENTSLYILGWAAPISTIVSLILCLFFLLYLKKKRMRSEKIKV